MKLVQCSMCGSKVILKLNEEFYECQSCGTKFKKSDVTEFEAEAIKTKKDEQNKILTNYIARADDFFKSGDYSQASVYYNKALDIDAANIYCQERLKELQTEKEKISVRFVKKDLSIDECKLYFLHWLKHLHNIPINIYENLTITSVTELYYSFGVCSYDISGNFSGAAIDEYGFTTPWTGRYHVNEKDKVYFHSSYLLNQKFQINYDDLADNVIQKYSTYEYDNLFSYENIPIKKDPLLKAKAYEEAEKHCNHNAENSIRDTAIKQLKNIELLHDKYVFEYYEVFLPFCEIKYKYKEKEYHWIMCLKGHETIYTGTYPYLNTHYADTSINFSQRRSILEETAQEKISEINNQLRILDSRIENIRNEKATLESKMSAQIVYRKPWNIDSSFILIFVVPLIGFLGYIFISLFIGYILLAIDVVLMLFCIISLIRNHIIKNEIMTSQILYNKEFQEISDKEQTILSKINETKKMLFAQRESIENEYLSNIEELEKQNMRLIVEELPRKLVSDCFTFIETYTTPSIFYKLPSWIDIYSSNDVIKKRKPCQRVTCAKIREKRTPEAEYNELHKTYLKKHHASEES